MLRRQGAHAEVFDPNCCGAEEPERALERTLRDRHWDLVGFSTTGMTLRFDLALAHLTRRLSPASLLVAGGMEATFQPDLMFELGPFDLVVLGEGERPIAALLERMVRSEPLDGIAGTVVRQMDGSLVRIPQMALDRDELVESIAATPYEDMPYERYWERLEEAYRLDSLPYKAQREAHLAEIRSVRLITLNYCPMNCTFCSSTNFLHAAQDSIARVGRLEADEILTMIERIVATQPGVRTIIFQDDIFVFRQDKRILPLCDAILEAKASNRIPPGLEFISTNRIDAMTPERLAAMRAAGFRVLGFGVESFSRPVLEEFNKKQIFPHIDTNLKAALDLGITPFLDLILTSPRCGLPDLAESIRRAFRWILAGCEAGMYPYVIPFSGAAMAQDPTLEPHTVYARHRIAGTTIEWEQPSKILPVDAEVRHAILEIEARFARALEQLEPSGYHLPSRVRSLLWVVCATPILSREGLDVPDIDEALTELRTRLPSELATTVIPPGRPSRALASSSR